MILRFVMSILQRRKIDISYICSFVAQESGHGQVSVYFRNTVSDELAVFFCGVGMLKNKSEAAGKLALLWRRVAE